MRPTSDNGRGRAPTDGELGDFVQLGGMGEL